MEEFPRLDSNVLQLSHLCDICSSRFPSQGPWPWFLNFSRTPDPDGVLLGYTCILQLRQSAERSCHLCTLLLEAIPTEMKRIGLEDDGGLAAEICFKLQILPDSGKWILRMQPLLKGKNEDLLLVRALPPTSMKADSRSWILQPSIGTRTSLAAIQTRSTYNIHPLMVHQIKQWLGNCLGQHSGCQWIEWADKIADNPTFRLIDIGVAADSNVRLVDAHRFVESRKYMTLSYRWTAETERTSLKTSNKNEFYRSISILDWPEIYIDALYIARQLEVRFIWIDSLCIVQDDEKDWEKQAAQMDAIYTNGVLNLAGSEGNRCPGLKMRRNPLRVSPCSLISYGSLSDKTEAHWLCYRPDDFEKSVNESPLYERGWTFQERVLSKRTVHFGEQLFWECACLRASEAFPIGTDHPDCTPADDAILQIKKELRNCHILNQEQPFSSSSKLHLLWSTVIRNYTKTRLTKASDRLVALRGIANSISRSFGLSKSDYAAGLWKPHLTHQLLWAREQDQYTNEDIEMSSYLTNYFPSWSWASCPGETRFIIIYTMWSQSFIKFKFDDASNEYDTTPSPTHLVISGRLIPCEEIENEIVSAPSCLQHTVMVRTANKAFKVAIELDRPVTNVSLQELSKSYSTYSRLGVFYCDIDALQGYLGKYRESLVAADREGSVVKGRTNKSTSKEARGPYEEREEKARDSSYHEIRYCKRCDSTKRPNSITTNLSQARKHLREFHGIRVTKHVERSDLKKQQHGTITDLFGRQEERQANRDLDQEEYLANAINIPAFEEALARLLAICNIAHTFIEYNPRLSPIRHRQRSTEETHRF